MQMSAFGGALGDMISQGVQNMHGRIMDVRQFDYQKDLNSQGIQWRVADALAAGIHPLYALGPTGATYSPVSSSGGSSGAGQDISRAVMAGMDRQQREREIQAGLARSAAEDRRAEERHALDMAQGTVELQRMRSQLARADSAQLGPGVPQGSIRRLPSPVIVGERNVPARQPGAITGHQFVRNSDGSIGIVQSEQMKERTEDDFIEQSLWALRNRVLSVPPPPSPDQYPTRPGYEWRWSPAQQAFYQRRRRNAVSSSRRRRSSQNGSSRPRY